MAITLHLRPREPASTPAASPAEIRLSKREIRALQAQHSATLDGRRCSCPYCQ